MESSLVQVIESSLVAPREATPIKALWLSPLDVFMAKLGHTPVICLYRSGATLFDVPRLKAAMAQALVAFYPLAGRLGVDDDGRASVIRCNGEGALFVVARSPCLTAQDVDFSKPSPELKSLFVPSIEPAAATTLILATQVTSLKCGAVVLGVSIHHAAVDGTSASHFMETWSAFYRDDDHGDASSETAAKAELPCHDRTLLHARSPPVVHPTALSLLYYPSPNGLTIMSSSAPSPSPTTTRTSMVTKVFPISRDQLVTLKRLCSGNSGGPTASTFVSLSALVWQCTSIVRRLPPNAIMRLAFPINIRRRYTKPPLPSNYFGNASIPLCATGAAGEIASEPLPSVAARIRGAMARVEDEVVRSAIDHVDMANKQDNNWSSGRMVVGMPETDLRIVSWLNVPLGLDLGCGDGDGGGPQVVTRAGTFAGRVYLIDDYGTANHRGVGVVVRMEAEQMEEFQRLLYARILQ